MAAPEVVAPEGEERRLPLEHRLLAEALAEVGKQAAVARHPPGVHQGGLVLLVGPRLLDALGDRAHGVADLETEVPQQVEDLVDDRLDVLRKLVGGPWHQEQKVDVRAGVERAPAVAAGRHQRQHRRRLLAPDRRVEDGRKHHVEQLGPRPGDLEPAPAGPVAELDAVLLDLHEALEQRDPLGRRQLALGGRLERDLGMGFERLQVG